MKECVYQDKNIAFLSIVWDCVIAVCLAMNLSMENAIYALITVYNVLMVFVRLAHMDLDPIVLQII